jgi:hypothetical protein
MKVRTSRVSKENCEVLIRVLVEREVQKRGREIICDVNCLMAPIVP